MMQEYVTEFGEGYICDDAGTTCAFLMDIREKDWSDLELRMNNIDDLETLQKVMNEEEDKMYSLDEVLSRVLSFYGKFVPYKPREQLFKDGGKINSGKSA